MAPRFPAIGVELEAVGGDEAVFDGGPRGTVDPQRERFVEFLLEALEDDDGRVRKAAAKGVKSVATTTNLAESDAELEAPPASNTLRGPSQLTTAGTSSRSASTSPASAASAPSPRLKAAFELRRAGWQFERTTDT